MRHQAAVRQAGEISAEHGSSTAAQLRHWCSRTQATALQVSVSLLTEMSVKHGQEPMQHRPGASDNPSERELVQADKVAPEHVWVQATISCSASGCELERMPLTRMPLPVRLNHLVEHGFAKALCSLYVLAHGDLTQGAE